MSYLVLKLEDSFSRNKAHTRQQQQNNKMFFFHNRKSPEKFMEVDSVLGRFSKNRNLSLKKEKKRRNTRPLLTRIKYFILFR